MMPGHNQKMERNTGSGLLFSVLLKYMVERNRQNNDFTNPTYKHLMDPFCVSFKRIVVAPVLLMAPTTHFLENIFYKTKPTISLWEADSEPNCPFGSNLEKIIYCRKISSSG